MYESYHCSKMAEAITPILKKYDLTIKQPGHVTLYMKNYDRLAIEVIQKYFVSVAHYYEQNGDLVADPEMVFQITENGWLPTGIGQVLTGWEQLVRLDHETGKRMGSLARIRSAAEFGQQWGQNIIEQDWLKHGKTEVK